LLRDAGGWQWYALHSVDTSCLLGVRAPSSQVIATCAQDGALEDRGALVLEGEDARGNVVAVLVPDAVRGVAAGQQAVAVDGNLAVLTHVSPATDAVLLLPVNAEVALGGVEPDQDDTSPRPEADQAPSDVPSQVVDDYVDNDPLRPGIQQPHECSSLIGMFASEADAALRAIGAVASWRIDGRAVGSPPLGVVTGVSSVEGEPVVVFVASPEAARASLTGCQPES